MGFMRTIRAVLGTRGDTGDGTGLTMPAGVQPPLRSWTQVVSLDQSLTLPAVFAAFRILSTAVGQLELGVWRAGLELIPTPALVRSPDVYLSPSSFLKRTVISLAGSGNAYWRRYNHPDGTVANLEALNPLAMHIDRDRYGNKRYHYSDPYRYPGGRTFTAGEVVHLRFLEVPGHVYGLGPVQACRASLSGALELRDYGSGWFSESAIPTGVLSTQQQLTPAAADAYKERWHETQKTRDVAVLGQGLAYEPIMLKPADAQFLESQQFSVTDIARMFGIPASHLLAEVNGDAMTYQNMEQADVTFVRYCLMAYLKEIEDAMSGVLPRGQSARFKIDGLLRPDSKTRAEVNTQYLDAGVLTINEVRAAEGLPPVPWGNGRPQPRPAAQQAPDTAQEALTNA